MACDRPRTDGQHSREPSAFAGYPPVSNCVDTPVDHAQPLQPDLVVDDVRGNAGTEELSARNHSVLLIGEDGDQLISAKLDLTATIPVKSRSVRHAPRLAPAAALVLLRLLRL
jgi:hypothetical protein